MKLLHFHFYHPLNSKEGIIYLQALRHKMIISKDHILQEKHYNLTYILLTHAYPLHRMIKNIKALIYTCNNLLLFSQSHTKTTYINSWHTRTFSPYMVFEYHHNIQNWLVSMAIPSLHSSRYFFFFLVFGGHIFWCIIQETSIKSSFIYLFIYLFIYFI